MSETSSTATAWEWAATGSTWRIHHGGGVDAVLAADVARKVERDEARWSRFRPHSELAEINRQAGQPVEVSPDTLELLAACGEWSSRTGGVFQPLIGGVLVSWGYRESLTEGPAGVRSSPTTRRVDGRLDVNRRAGTVRISRGTRLDLGGIAKSWMAVRVAELVCQRCDDDRLLIDAGGDLVAARGDHVVAVEAPGAVPLKRERGCALPIACRVLLPAGHGIATSGWGRRRWTNGDGCSAHHLIDPETGAPGAFAHATVVSPDPVAADVLAKTVCLRPLTIETIAEAAMLAVGEQVYTNRGWEGIALTPTADVAGG